MAPTPSASSESSSGSTRSARPGGLFDLAVVESRPGLVSFRVTGRGAEKAFQHEAGGHRWQTVPPTEKRGRVHTSTVTVAVLAEPTETEVALDDRDVEVTVSRGSGPGGQHRNKTESCVVATHKPTGISARCEETRSQTENRLLAFAVLRARLYEAAAGKRAQERSDTRREQVGSGMRGDKRRTIRTQDGVVTDHVLGKRWRLTDYLRGNW